MRDPGNEPYKFVRPRHKIYTSNKSTHVFKRLTSKSDTSSKCLSKLSKFSTTANDSKM